MHRFDVGRVGSKTCAYLAGAVMRIVKVGDVLTENIPVKTFSEKL